ncbi:hypothetical protein LSUE1_G005813, partial [Lachnellula suecica]
MSNNSEIMVKEEQTANINPSPTVDAFFTRNGLSSADQTACYTLVSRLYPNEPIVPASSQGYCSLTLFVGPSTVIQFRPPTYRLDLTTTSRVSAIHTSYAPKTSHIAILQNSGLEVYSMSRVPGISLQDIRAQSPALAREPLYLENLCTTFAAFLARSWHHPPLSATSIPLGKVGRSLESRLQLLATSLPTRFKPLARSLLGNIEDITSLPWVLTHGDLMPGNMMLSPSSGHLSGFVDWAEAEFLPFGVCLYGLEEILGEMTSEGFRYHEQAERLRAEFWAELERRVGGGSGVLCRVRIARDLGVLLWWG